MWENFRDSDIMVDLISGCWQNEQSSALYLKQRTLVGLFNLHVHSYLQTVVLSVVLLAIFTCSLYLRNMRCSSIVNMCTCCSSNWLPGSTCHGLHVHMLIKIIELRAVFKFLRRDLEKKVAPSVPFFNARL